jgi:GH15 family glucan-1,4-alpha-glucosidase
MMNDDVLNKKAQEIGRSSQVQIERCYNSKLKAYTQAIDSEELDASSLQLINMRYLDSASEKAKAHLAALEKKLMTPEGLFYRYLNGDNKGVPETSFLICSFWYIEALANVGRIADACAALERVLKCSNHLGLLSEDADGQFGQWGNFPQAYSHVGLMNAVYRIAARQDVPMFY